MPQSKAKGSLFIFYSFSFRRVVFKLSTIIKEFRTTNSEADEHLAIERVFPDNCCKIGQTITACWRRLNIFLENANDEPFSYRYICIVYSVTIPLMELCKVILIFSHRYTFETSSTLVLHLKGTTPSSIDSIIYIRYIAHNRWDLWYSKSNYFV